MRADHDSYAASHTAPQTLEPPAIPRDWTFRSRDVADTFDSHVREQLPWYDLASGALAHLARHYLPERGRLYDVGASTGNLGRLLADTLEARAAIYTAVDSSPEMAERYRGPGVLEVADAVTYAFQPFDVAVLNLTLSFVPVADRDELLERLEAARRPGGAILVLDKADAAAGYLGTVLRRLTLAGKAAAGADADGIVAKELALGGVQRPVDPDRLPGEPRQFFRFGEFAGWIIDS